MTQQKIEWRNITIENYQHYEVSNTGLVKSPNYRMTGKPALLKGRVYEGYTAINFKSAGCKQRTIQVHRLVALAFLGDPPTPDHQVDHIDHDRQNNHVSNLRWVTRQENCQNRKYKKQ